MKVVIALLLLIPVLSDPELTNLSSRNECIKSIVQSFIRVNTCATLSQHSKSQLAMDLTNCLLIQMNKPTIACVDSNDCQLQGDSWNTFTTFFTHIDNLCHFYWEVSKAERAEQMIDALMSSASKTEKTLSVSNENTKQILELQTSLRLQMLHSLASQEQLTQIISNSSLTLNSLTSEMSQSLTRIHADIDQHYAVISRVLSGINQVLTHLDGLQTYLLAEVTSVQGVAFFVGLTVLVFVGCLLSDRVRDRRNQCLVLVCGHFLVEFFVGGLVEMVVGVRNMRYASIVAILGLVALGRSARNGLEEKLQQQLNSERMRRIMERALRKELSDIAYRKLLGSNIQKQAMKP